MSDNVLPIKTVLDNDYKKFSRYSVERTLSNLDGLTTVRRKILWTLFKHRINSFSTIKRLTWIANTSIAETNYQHGDASILESCSSMVNDFPGSNNFPLVYGEGQTGNILDPEAGEGRYINGYLHENFYKFFDDVDLELSPKNYSEGQEVEPLYLRSKVPMVLLNGIESVAVGYSSKIMSYKLEDVVKIMCDYISNGKPVEYTLVPYVKGFTGSIYKNPFSKQIEVKGGYHIDGNNIVITSLPFNMTQQKMLSILANLKSKKIITDFDDNSTLDGWNIIVYGTAELVRKDKSIIEKLLNLVYRETETVTFLDETDICELNSVEEYIYNFSDKRLQWSKERIAEVIRRISKNIEDVDITIKFIHIWNNTVGIPKMTDAAIKDVLVVNGIHTSYHSKLLSMPISSLTLKRTEKLNIELQSLKNELNKWKSTTSEALTIREAKELVKFFV